MVAIATEMTTGIAIVMKIEIEIEIIVNEMITTATSGRISRTMKDMVTDITECAINLLNTPVVSVMVVCIKNNGKFFFQCSVLAQS